jgi:CheY-like chemotaxis protein
MSAEPESAVPAPSPARMPYVLVVDDESDIRSLLCEYFEAQSFRVTSATEGWQAVVQAEGLKVDLLICDVMMPGVKGSGIDAYRMLRESRFVRRDLPIIFVTAMPVDQVKAALPADPLVRVFPKPIDFAALRAAVRELCGR